MLTDLVKAFYAVLRYIFAFWWGVNLEITVYMIALTHLI